MEIEDASVRQKIRDLIHMRIGTGEDLGAVQHATLTLERWASFSLDHQILMIGNEMNRAGKLDGPSDAERRRNAYERVLALTDLTIRLHPKRNFRRELLRWRDLVAALYVACRPEAAAHRAACVCLLRFTPQASKQIPMLFPFA